VTIQIFEQGGNFAVIRGLSLKGHSKPWNNRPVQIFWTGSWEGLLRDLSGRKFWTGRLFHGFGCPLRDEPRITAKWPPSPKFWIVKKFSFFERNNLQKEFPEYLIPKKILHFTHSKAIDVVYIVQNPWRGFEESAIRAWPRHLVEDQDRKQGSVTHFTTFMTECRSQDRAMSYLKLPRNYRPVQKSGSSQMFLLLRGLTSRKNFPNICSLKKVLFERT